MWQDSKKQSAVIAPHRVTHSRVRLRQPANQPVLSQPCPNFTRSFQKAKDLNSKDTFLIIFAKTSWIHIKSLHFSALLPLPHTVLSNNSPSSLLHLYICLRLGQVTALRELRPNPTPTQLTHIIPAIFHKKGTFDINQPPSLSSLSLMCAQKTD